MVKENMECLGLGLDWGLDFENWVRVRRAGRV